MCSVWECRSLALWPGLCVRTGPEGHLRITRINPSCSQAMADYSTALLMRGTPDIKVLVNRGLLYLQLRDHSNALMDFAEASKVRQVNHQPET